MTAVLVVVQGGRAWVGADSRGTGPAGAFRDDAAKVIRAHGWVWAVAGSAVVAAWLRAYLRPQGVDEPDETYLLAQSYDAQLWLKTRKAACCDEDEEHVHLVAARGGRAWVATGMGTEEIGELYAMGEPIAPAAAFLCTDGGLPVPDRIRLAIEAVARVTAYVGGPVNVVEAI